MAAQRSHPTYALRIRALLAMHDSNWPIGYVTPSPAQYSGFNFDFFP